jgi:hypothetical protein
MLDNAPVPVQQLSSRTTGTVLYQPLGGVPSVLRFEVRQNDSRP